MNKLKYVLLITATVFCLGNTDCHAGSENRRNSIPERDYRKDMPGSAMPEPGAGLLFAIGVAGLAYWTDRNRRKRNG